MKRTGVDEGTLRAAVDGFEAIAADVAVMAVNRDVDDASRLLRLGGEDVLVKQLRARVHTEDRSARQDMVKAALELGRGDLLPALKDACRRDLGFDEDGAGPQPGPPG